MIIHDYLEAGCFSVLFGPDIGLGSRNDSEGWKLTGLRNDDALVWMADGQVVRVISMTGLREGGCNRLERGRNYGPGEEELTW